MKPKIHAFCNAGCKWETVHKDDFLRSASVVEVPLDGATECELEVGAKYRFTSTIDYYNWTEESSTVLIFGEDHGEGVFNTNLISHYEFDTFRTEHTIEIIAVRIKGGQLHMAYLIDDTRHEFTYPRDIGGATSVDELTLTFKLLYVDKIYRYNKHAEIKCESVPAATAADNGKVLTAENGVMVWKENSASGGELYLHNVQISTGLPYNIVIDVYTTTSEPITYYQALLEKLGSGTYHSATYNGSEGHGNGYMMLSQSGEIYFYGVLRSSYNDTIYTEKITEMQIQTIEDSVIQV